MKCLLVIGILAAMAILAAIALAGPFVHEDSLLWNCYLMGNHQCGNADQVVGFITLGQK